MPLGLYSVSKEVATTPSGQIITPIIKPLYVNLANYLDSPKTFKDKINKILLSISIIVLPIAFGISATSENITHSMLGSKWAEAIPLIEILAFVIIPGTFNSFLNEVCTVLGKVKALFYFDVFLGVITIAAFVSLAKGLSIEEFAQLRIAIGLFSLVAMFFYLYFSYKLQFIRPLMLILPVFCSAILMYLCVLNISQHITINNAVLHLIVEISIGILSYGLTMLLLMLLLKRKLKEYDFLWKTFLEPLINKISRKFQ